MKATNRNRVSTMAYEIDASRVVKKNSAGSFIEEYAWTNVVLILELGIQTKPKHEAFRKSEHLVAQIPE